MIGWFKNLKEIYEFSKPLAFIESEMNEMSALLDQKIKESTYKFELLIKETLKDSIKSFEDKVQKMTFAYTANLDDTKSDYLKKYVETRLDCLQTSVMRLPQQVAAIQSELTTLKLEKMKEPEDK